MRNGLLFLLLAGAAVPALAADESDDRAARREAFRAERAERAESRAERAEPRVERAEPNGERDRPAFEAVRERVMESRRPPDVQVEPAADRPALQEAVRERVMDRRPPRMVEIESAPPAVQPSHDAIQPRVRERRGPRLIEVGSAPAAIEPSQDVATPRVRERRGPRMVEVGPGTPSLEQRGESDSVGTWRRPERRGTGRPALVEQRSDNGWEPLRRRTAGTDRGLAAIRAPIVSRMPREGTQPPARTESRRWRGTGNHWRGDWRSDHRYDWRSHRRRHRSLFHFGFYYDPFGWSYRPYSIGWRLWPGYYRSSYWLQDPWAYRLPYAPPGYRWIRYYDDALLVDTWDGTVIDVIRDFFW